jgi:hypothetical protein
LPTASQPEHVVISQAPLRTLLTLRYQKKSKTDVRFLLQISIPISDGLSTRGSNGKSSVSISFVSFFVDKPFFSH